MTPPFQRFHIRFIEKTLSRTKCEQFSGREYGIKKHGHISYFSFVFECTLASNLTIKCSSARKKNVPIVGIHYLETGLLIFNQISGTQQFVSVD